MGGGIMNSLKRRVDKLEEEKAGDFNPAPIGKYDIADLERARQRVLAANPDHKFCDLPPDPSLSFVERLERGRQWALYRLSISATEVRQ